MSYTEEVLGIVNKAYNEGEGRIGEDVGEKDRGDGLATFLRNEITDVAGASHNKLHALEATQRALYLVLDELNSVNDAVNLAIFEELNKENSCGN